MATVFMVLVLALYLALDIGSELLLHDAAQRVLARVLVLSAISTVGVVILLHMMFDHTAEQFRVHEVDRQAREKAARLEGALTAASSMQHYLGNQPALTRGYAELLARDPDLPHELHAPAQEALRGALEASATLDKLQELTDFELAPLAGPAVLELEKTQSPNPPSLRRKGGRACYVFQVDWSNSSSTLSARRMRPCSWL